MYCDAGTPFPSYFIAPVGSASRILPTPTKWHTASNPDWYCQNCWCLPCFQKTSFQRITDCHYHNYTPMQGNPQCWFPQYQDDCTSNKCVNVSAIECTCSRAYTLKVSTPWLPPGGSCHDEISALRNRYFVVTDEGWRQVGQWMQLDEWYLFQFSPFNVLLWRF